MTDKLKLCMFDVVLQSLVSLNMDRRQHVDVDYSSVHDLRNYATVRFDTGEGTGKTTWLHGVEPYAKPRRVKKLHNAELRGRPLADGPA